MQGRDEKSIEKIWVSEPEGRDYLQYLDIDGLRNVGFFTAQPFDPAGSPRELHHTQSPGKQQISRGLLLFKLKRENVV
jgi:hypothetical protein